MTGPIPTYELYGEDTPGPDLDILHCETIPARSGLHGGVIAPHRHAHLYQLFFLGIGEVRMTLDGNEFRPRPPA